MVRQKITRERVNEWFLTVSKKSGDILVELETELREIGTPSALAVIKTLPLIPKNLDSIAFWRVFELGARLQDLGFRLQCRERGGHNKKLTDPNDVKLLLLAYEKTKSADSTSRELKKHGIKVHAKTVRTRLRELGVWEGAIAFPGKR